MQYIGRLMRDVDPAPIREQLDALTGHSAQEAARHRRLEALRERLLADDDALTDYRRRPRRRRPAGAAHADPQRAHASRRKASRRAPSASSSGS